MKGKKVKKQKKYQRKQSETPDSRLSARGLMIVGQPSVKTLRNNTMQHNTLKLSWQINPETEEQEYQSRNQSRRSMKRKGTGNTKRTQASSRNQRLWSKMPS